MSTANDQRHDWLINITCPRCRHRGDVSESFPCCECAARLREDVARLSTLVGEMVEALDAVRLLKEEGNTQRTADKLGMGLDYRAHGPQRVAHHVWARARAILEKARAP